MPKERPGIPIGAVKRHLCFLFLAMLCVAPFCLFPNNHLRGFSFQDDRYSHILFIPVVSFWLVYLNRKSTFLQPRYCLSWGLPLILPAIVFSCSVQASAFSDQNNYLSCAALAIVCSWIAAFVLSYGPHALRAARFPLAFLLLMIPMPTFLLDRVVGALQAGSAVITRALFGLLGVSVTWRGLEFSLKDVHFEIARECSGIHSTLILFIAAIVAGHLFLRSIWSKVSFSVFAVLVAIFKNAVRIVIISSLTVYVDPSFANGWLHRKGGVVFAALGIAILVPALLALRKAEHRFQRQPPATAAIGRPRAEEPPSCEPA